DRCGLDRGEGDARPPDAPPRRPLSRVRLRAARRLHHARPLRGRARARTLGGAPAQLPGSLLRGRGGSIGRRRRPGFIRPGAVGFADDASSHCLEQAPATPPSGRRCGGTGCGAGRSSARTCGPAATSSTSSSGAGRLFASSRSKRRRARGSATRSRWSRRRSSGGCVELRRRGSTRVPVSRGSRSASTLSPCAKAACSACRRRSSPSVESRRVAVTQDELYATLDLDLSWSEAELPERERTKHVHRLHPYHGKFIPQLVEVLLDRYLTRGDHVLDPFAGSGTTLVQALESGLDTTGMDIAAFNCLLMRVKTAPYDLPELGPELQEVSARIESLPRRR